MYLTARELLIKHLSKVFRRYNLRYFVLRRVLGNCIKAIFNYVLRRFSILLKRLKKKSFCRGYKPPTLVNTSLRVSIDHKNVNVSRNRNLLKRVRIVQNRCHKMFKIIQRSCAKNYKHVSTGQMLNMYALHFSRRIYIDSYNSRPYSTKQKSAC